MDIELRGAFIHVRGHKEGDEDYAIWAGWMLEEYRGEPVMVELKKIMLTHISCSEMRHEASETAVIGIA